MYTEFISSEGLIRDAAKSLQKLDIFEYERPIGIQLFGSDIEHMREATIIATEVKPDLIDINYGCPVKKVACRGSGAALLQDIPKMARAKAAFSRAWAQPLTWENFTLANWSFTFLSSSTQGAIVNTLELGVLTACVGAGLAALLAYVTNRKLVVGHQLLSFLAMAPIVIPGTVLAVALFIAYTRPPFLLYGTLWILFIAYLTKEIPVGYSQSDATFRGIHYELEEAGRILGAGRLRVLGEITAPLAKSGIIATWCFIFIGVIRELSASIILFTPNTKVMSVVIFDLKEEGQFGAIAVLGLFMLAMTFAIVTMMQTLLGRDVLGARSSAGAQG